MKITENALRQIIKEELELLSEVVRDTHGYSVRSLSDVTWTPEKRRIPADRNPFVGSYEIAPSV